MRGGSLVLVTGLGEDSGKTSLTTGLLASFRSLGVEAIGFKPAGATNVWLHPEVLVDSSRRGFLVTWDSLKIHRASGEDLDLRILNPVAGFSLPPYTATRGPAGFLLLLAGNLALVRISECLTRGLSTIHLIVDGILDAAPKGVREAVEEAASRLRPPPFKVKPGFIAEVLGQPASKAADTCLESLLGKEGLVVAESNSDVAAPTLGVLERSRVVLVSGWGRVYLYSGEVWRRAVEASMIGGVPWSVKTGEILELARPERVVDLKLTPHGELDPDDGGALAEAVLTILEKSV
ncbi:conserved hypothetical protein [Aeropyrum pernix]|uniref:Uncharacterized protein n=1 Tax=Aeropyrum pernix TaxID=56636 RepID=A0A401HAL3_AERPX|nr:hypothetical protein [Aeropyrum pernix]GBF09505.1 conserved hypothetical protein [Aeropyrum pernix]